MDDQNKIVYSINVEDIQNVAIEQFGRELADKEVKVVEDRLGDYIDWYDSVCFALNNLARK